MCSQSHYPLLTKLSSENFIIQKMHKSNEHFNVEEQWKVEFILQESQALLSGFPNVEGFNPHVTPPFIQLCSKNFSFLVF